MGGIAVPLLPVSAAAMVAGETPTRSVRAFPASANLMRGLIRLRSRGSCRLVTVLAAVASQWRMRPPRVRAQTRARMTVRDEVNNSLVKFLA